MHLQKYGIVLFFLFLHFRMIMAALGLAKLYSVDVTFNQLCQSPAFLYTINIFI